MYVTITMITCSNIKCLSSSITATRTSFYSGTMQTKVCINCKNLELQALTKPILNSDRLSRGNIDA